MKSFPAIVLGDGTIGGDPIVMGRTASGLILNSLPYGYVAKARPRELPLLGPERLYAVVARLGGALSRPRPASPVVDPQSLV